MRQHDFYPRGQRGASVSDANPTQLPLIFAPTNHDVSPCRPGPLTRRRPTCDSGIVETLTIILPLPKGEYNCWVLPNGRFAANVTKNKHPIPTQPIACQPQNDWRLDKSQADIEKPHPGHVAGRPGQIKPELRGWGARPPRALLVAPSRPARWTSDSRAGTGLFRAHEVFREGAENSARGGHAPYSTSDFGFNAKAQRRKGADGGFGHEKDQNLVLATDGTRIF
jgi:hypothetical protein